jgi:hypothetical protein
MVTTTPSPPLNEPPSFNEYRSFHGMLCKQKIAKRCIKSFNNGVALFANQKEYYKCDDDDNGNNDLNNLNLSNYDFNNIESSGIPFNIWTYYSLVVLSLTGLCSILRITQCLKAVEYNNFNRDDNDANDDNDNNDANDNDIQQQLQLRRLVFRKGGDDNKNYIESTEIKNEKKKLRIPQNAIDYVINRSIYLGPLDPLGPIGDLDTTTKAPASASDNDDQASSIQLIRWFEYDFGYGSLTVMMLHFKCMNNRIHLVEVYKTDDTNTVLGYIIENIPLKLLYYIKSILQNHKQKHKQQ